MTDPLPATNTIYDQVLEGYFGGPATATGSADNVFTDKYRSNLWVNYLNSMGISPSDPHLDDILGSTYYFDHTAPKSLLLKNFLAEQSLPSNFNINDMSVGSAYWYKFLESQNLPPTYGPPTPAEMTQFSIFAIQLQSTIISDFATFAANFQANLQQNFVLYIQRTLFDLQTQQANLSSADEIKQRTIMFETFEILLKMLISLQDTVGVVGKNLIFFGKWQEQYTNMLTRVPIYTGGTASNIEVSGTDPLNISFGYNNINIDDIANWYASKVATGESSTFYITSQLTNQIQFDGRELETRTALKIEANPSASRGLKISLVQQIITVSGQKTRVYDQDGNDIELGTFMVRLPSPPTPNGGTGDFTSDADVFKATFKSFYNDLVAAGEIRLNGVTDPHTNFYTGTLYKLDSNGDLVPAVFDGNAFILGKLKNLPIFKITSEPGSTVSNWQTFQSRDDFSEIIPDSDPVGSLNVPWEHTFNDSTADKDRADQDSKARGEINARNQQYIENIRSRRQIVQDNAKQIESALSQAKESISEMANLLTSIMDSLKGLISSIFR